MKEREQNNKYLIHYLRDYRRVPFGCIVAVSPENIGISVCMKIDNFTKKEARNRALESAIKDSNHMIHVPLYRKVAGYYGYSDERTNPENVICMYDYVKEAVEYVKRRAQKFFKESN
jgi:hypothetical protein